MITWVKFKRILDICISLLFILALMPIWLLIALCIWLENPGPIIFKQQRVGQQERLFTIFKFRSMYVNNIPPLELGAIKHNHSLVTKIGYIIRRTKLDETPQFLNVLLGDMSLIGPRPCLAERLQTMSRVQKMRFQAVPGLSGWAEVNGNVDLSWDEQVWLDIWYVKNSSFLLDVTIFFRTIVVMLLGSEKNKLALNNAKKTFDQLLKVA